jgi:hypothetical protein
MNKSPKEENNKDQKRKCQQSWVNKFVWVETLHGEDGHVPHLKCVCCSFAKGKNVLLFQNLTIFFKKQVKEKPLRI